MYQIRLKELLDNKGVSAYEAAKHMDITVKGLYKIIHNPQQRVRDTTVKELCRYFEVSPNELISIGLD